MFYNVIDILSKLEVCRLSIGNFSYCTIHLIDSEDRANLNPVLKRLQEKMIHVPNVIDIMAFDCNISDLLKNQYLSLISESLVDKTGIHILYSVIRYSYR